MGWSCTHLCLTFPVAFVSQTKQVEAYIYPSELKLTADNLKRFLDDLDARELVRRRTWLRSVPQICPLVRFLPTHNNACRTTCGTTHQRLALRKTSTARVPTSFRVVLTSEQRVWC